MKFTTVLGRSFVSETQFYQFTQGHQVICYPEAQTLIHKACLLTCMEQENCPLGQIFTSGSRGFWGGGGGGGECCQIRMSGLFGNCGFPAKKRKVEGCLLKL